MQEMLNEKMSQNCLNTFIINLEQACSLYSTSPAFKIPIIDKTCQELHVAGYTDISFTEFYEDVLRYARYWYKVLQKDGIQHRAVVGLYVHGVTYMEVVHFYGIMRAGYVPQPINRAIYAVDVISHLLVESGTRALIYDGINFGEEERAVLLRILSPDNIRFYPLPDIISLDGAGVLPRIPPFEPEDIGLIFHTNGTSAIPKPVPMSYRLLDVLLKKVKLLCAPLSTQRQEVDSWIGSLCHVGLMTLLAGRLFHGTCTIQQTSKLPSRNEILAMIRFGLLSRASMFPVLLSRCIQDARACPAFLSLLRNLDGIITGGVHLPRDEELWAWQNGIRLINVYGCTESGIPMLIGGFRGGVVADMHPQLLRHLPLNDDDGTPLLHYEFLDEIIGCNRDGCPKLKELVVSPSSADRPDSMFCRDDGYFYTGDLFEEVAPAVYVYQGREGDWIKMSNALAIDTCAIEDNVREICGDLISECVVIGTGRPCPTLVVEPRDIVYDEDVLKAEIFSRISRSDFDAKCHSFERIASEKMIIVVEKGSLPRAATKGNVTRKLVEESFKERLDAIYADVPLTSPSDD